MPRRQPPEERMRLVRHHGRLDAANHRLKRQGPPRRQYAPGSEAERYYRLGVAEGNEIIGKLLEYAP